MNIIILIKEKLSVILCFNYIYYTELELKLLKAGSS